MELALYTSMLQLNLSLRLGGAGPSSESWQVPSSVPPGAPCSPQISAPLVLTDAIRAHSPLLNSTTGSALQVLPTAWQGAVACPDLASHQPRAAARALKLRFFRREHSLARVPNMECCSNSTPGFVCDSFP